MLASAIRTNALLTFKSVFLTWRTHTEEDLGFLCVCLCVCVCVCHLFYLFQDDLRCLFSPHKVNHGGVQKPPPQVSLYKSHTTEESLRRRRSCRYCQVLSSHEHPTVLKFLEAQKKFKKNKEESIFIVVSRWLVLVSVRSESNPYCGICRFPTLIKYHPSTDSPLSTVGW